jgi:hypothetical protein
VRTGTGRFGTGGSPDTGGSRPRADLYGDAALYRRRYELARAEVDQLHHERRQFNRAADFIRLLRPWTVAVPMGQHATGNPSFVAPALPSRVVRIPTQRVAPDGIASNPRTAWGERRR